MNEDLIIKHLDILLKNIKNVTQFDLNGILTKYGDFKHDIPEQNENFVRICESVKRIGKTYKYFDSEKNRPSVYFLMENGINAKKIGGHLKFQNSLNKKPLDWYKISAIILTVIFGVLNLYQKYDYNNLKTQYNSLKTTYENSENNILLKNSVNKVFSNPNKKDNFTISIIGKNILNGEMVFKIIDSEGIEILNERYPSSDLINGYILDKKSSSKELEEYIKKRVSEFFKEDNFFTPALNIDSEFDSDYSDKKIWTDIKSDSTAVGFYYLIGLENGCRIAYSKKQKKVLKYFCCC